MNKQLIEQAIEALANCRKHAIESGAYESYRIVGESFDELEKAIAALCAERNRVVTRIENTQNLYTSEQRVQKTAASIHVTEGEEEAFRAISDRLSPT